MKDNKGIKDINEIIDISKYYNNKNNVRVEKIAGHRLKVEMKQVKQLLKKLYKQILKSAKRGDFRLFYDCKRYLTTSQKSAIDKYFTDMGYFVLIEDYGYRIKPSIEIKWDKVVNYEECDN